MSRRDHTIRERSDMTATALVRRERPDDADAIRRVHNAAFGTDVDTSTAEARLVDDLRSGEGWIPALSLVAEVDGAVVGHVVATRGRLERGGSTLPVRTLGIGPVGVLPAHQQLRLGSSMMYALLGAALALDEEVACLLGSDYYRRFGFVISSTVGITPPVPGWAQHFQALVLDPTRLGEGGTFRYAEAFDRLP
jgi:putative acetyltransferase